MRMMMFAIAVMALNSAYAADELKFGDLNYLFKHGQINASANVNSVYSKSEMLGTVEEERGVVTSTQLTYAFSDHLNAFIGLDYAYDLQTETSGNADVDSDGLANPALGAIYRVMNQSDTAYNIDLGAVGRFNIQDAETGNAVLGESEDGNFANSRSSLELLARIGRKWNESNEWQLASGLVYFKDGESTNKEVTGDVTQDDESSMDLYLRASYQYRPVNEIMFLLFAQATRVGEFDSELENNGGDIERDSHIDYDFGFTAKFLVTENFIANFNYGLSRNSSYDIEEAGFKDENQDRRENYFGFGLDFLF